MDVGRRADERHGLNHESRNASECERAAVVVRAGTLVSTREISMSILTTCALADRRIVMRPLPPLPGILARCTSSGGSGLSPGEAASIYAAHACRIFQCRPDGDRRPMISDWPRHASADVDLVARWWTWEPRALIGHPLTGTPVVVLDGDRHEGKADGVQMLHNVLTAAEIAPTLWVETAGGGRHVPLRLPPGVTCGNSSPWPAGTIDIRGPGDALPSVEPTSADPVAAILADKARRIAERKARRAEERSRSRGLTATSRTEVEPLRGGFLFMPGSRRADGRCWRVAGPAAAGLDDRAALALYARAMATGEGLPIIPDHLLDLITQRATRRAGVVTTLTDGAGGEMSLLGDDEADENGFPLRKSEAEIGRHYADKHLRAFHLTAGPGSFNTPTVALGMKFGALVRLRRITRAAAWDLVYGALVEAGGDCPQHEESAARALADGILRGWDEHGGGVPVNVVWAAAQSGGRP